MTPPAKKAVANSKTIGEKPSRKFERVKISPSGSPMTSPPPAMPPPASTPSAAEGPQYGAAQRWTPSLVQDGFTPVSDFFLKNYSDLVPPISTGEAMFIIHLMSFKWTSKAPRPSMRRIADRMGVSEVAVRGYARSLEGKKYLTRIKRVGKTNHFKLRQLFNVLEELRTANQKLVVGEEEIED